MKAEAKLAKGMVVRSKAVIPWPTGTTRTGRIVGVIPNATPLGGSDADTYVVKWFGFHETGPHWANDLEVLG